MARASLVHLGSYRCSTHLSPIGSFIGGFADEGGVKRPASGPWFFSICFTSSCCADAGLIGFFRDFSVASMSYVFLRPSATRWPERSLVNAPTWTLWARFLKSSFAFPVAAPFLAMLSRFLWVSDRSPSWSKAAASNRRPRSFSAVSRASATRGFAVAPSPRYARLTQDTVLGDAAPAFGGGPASPSAASSAAGCTFHWTLYM
mmetsp:Transcript_49377/g.139326  ORF Transcript_49377/g.139326 Transcript_49377/m.139326 type:complete len:203 (-) Transcript_49377:362-970(-)